MSIMVDLLPGWESRPCAGTDPVLWFGPPEVDEPGGYVEPTDQRLWREGRARAVCAPCPLRAACLEAELELPPGHMWGSRAGLTAPERRALRRRRREAARRRHRVPAAAAA